MEERVFRAADGTRLHGLAFRRREPRAAVLFFGGNAFHSGTTGLRRARTLGAAGVDIFFIDYRGYGQSEGKPTIDALKADADAVYDSLVGSGAVRPERLIVHGHSLGSFVAAHLATMRTIAGLVMEAPITDVDEHVAARTPWFAKLLLDVRADSMARKESNLERVRRVDVPLLVLGGADDRVTPPGMARRIFEAAATPEIRKRLHILGGSGHNDMTANPAFATAYEQFLALPFPGTRTAEP
ncbi:MAG: alpha/beta fold hydrolase [Gemmatimonadota bacterium]